MNLDVALLIIMVAGAVWTALAADLLKSAIGLAVTSAILAIIMFRLLAPLAAVFELSVCAGLITVVFISVISLTRPGIERSGRATVRFGAFVVVPLLVLGAGLALFWLKFQPDLGSLIAAPRQEDMRLMLWGERRLDLLGQVVVLLAGIFGVVVLFKERGQRSSAVAPGAMADAKRGGQKVEDKGTEQK